MKWNRCRLFSAWVPCLSRWKQEDRERNRELTDTLTRYLTQFSQAYEVQVYTENENQLQRYDHRYILNITGEDTVKPVLRDHYIERHVSWHILYWQKVINSMILNESSKTTFLETQHFWGWSFNTGFPVYTQLLENIPFS